MRSLSLDISWTRLTALILLPFFTVNILSVSLVTAASGDEYLTGSTEPIVEMIAPDVWLDAALTEESTGSTETVEMMADTGTTVPDTGSIVTGDISTGSIQTVVIFTGSSLTGVIETATGIDITMMTEST